MGISENISGAVWNFSQPAMAASSVARSATTPFPLNVSKPSQSDHFPKTALNFDARFKRCRIALALASLRSDDNDHSRNGGHGHNHLVGGALELDSSALEDFPYDVVSQDLHTLPSTIFRTCHCCDCSVTNRVSFSISCLPCFRTFVIDPSLQFGL